MHITMLGTGHAVVTECYNTCWVLTDGEGQCLLVDGGGGSGLVTQMAHAGIAWTSVREIFVTHKHIDHLLGIVWALRMLGAEIRRGSYEGDLHIRGNAEALGVLGRMARDLLWGEDNDLLGDRIRLEAVGSDETGLLLGKPVTYFDLHARAVSQMGFVLEYAPGHRLVCCGDVALKPEDEWRAVGAEWLLHEAFCLSDHPAASFIHRVGHSTVAEAAATAERVGARNLLLYHTEDHDLAHRRERYTARAQQIYSGTIHVPDDLEVIDLEAR